MKQEGASVAKAGGRGEKPEEEALLLDRLLQAIPSMSAPERAHYERRQSEERAIVLGTKTSADEYIRAALKVYSQVAEGVEKLPESENEERRIAVREAALQPRLVTAARESAAQLQRALDDETAVGRKTRSHQDSPQMNIFEGRATLSLRRMRGVYNSARAERHNESSVFSRCAESW